MVKFLTDELESLKHNEVQEALDGQETEPPLLFLEPAGNSSHSKSLPTI